MSQQPETHSPESSHPLERSQLGWASLDNADNLTGAGAQPLVNQAGVALRNSDPSEAVLSQSARCWPPPALSSLTNVE